MSGPTATAADFDQALRVASWGYVATWGDWSTWPYITSLRGSVTATGDYNRGGAS